MKLNFLPAGSGRVAAAAGLTAAVLLLSACYVVPVNQYPAPSSTTVVVQPAPAPASVTFAVRLYPANTTAAAHGMVHAVVTNDLNGRGTFNATIGGEVFTGEATRRAGSSRDGVANGAGNRGSYLSCQYQMNSSTLGTGNCRHSDGAQFSMHIGH